jgi:hypothetical protein
MIGTASLARAGILLLACALVLGGCGNESKDAPGVATAVTATGESAPGTASPVDTERRYALCLRDEGVTMIEGAGGALEVDKERTPFATVDKASKACARYEPAVELPDPPTADELERLRAFAGCMRDEGVTGYPDPDPQSGLVPPEEVLGAKIKTDPTFRAALETCQEQRSNAGSEGTPGG